MSKFLITYWHHHLGKYDNEGFHHDIVDNPIIWLEDMQQYVDGGDEYVLIASFPVSDEWAEKWRGNLGTM